MKKRIRLNLVLSEGTKQKIERLLVLTDKETSAEIIKTGIDLLETIVEQRKSGKEFLIRDKKTGDTMIIQPIF